MNDDSLTKHLLDDETLANNLNEIATEATKTVTTKEDSWTVPDYATRLKGLEIQFKLKWHFKEKAAWQTLPKWIYIFSD